MCLCVYVKLGNVGGIVIVLFVSYDIMIIERERK